MPLLSFSAPKTRSMQVLVDVEFRVGKVESGTRDLETQNTLLPHRQIKVGSGPS